jgi:SulP family sulfate permease
LLGGMAGCAMHNLKTHPLSSNIVMLTTVTVVVATHNLAYGVFIGVLMAAMFFANKIGHYMAVTSELNADGSERTYQVFGEVFFRSADMFVTGFDLKEKLPKVVIDLTHAHFWDITSVAALDKVVLKFRKEGVEVDVINMNKATTTIVDNFGVHHKPEDITQVMGH